MIEYTPTTEFALVDDEHIKALLVPYNEVGQNANGKHVFSAATATEIPADPSSIVLKLAHDGQGASHIAARAVSLEEVLPHGIVATYKKEPGIFGDRFFDEHRAGKKKNVSPEFSSIVRDGDHVVSARLTGSAAAVLGGFPSAAFFSLAETAVPEAPEVAPATEEPQPEEPAEPQEENMSGTDVVTRPGSLPPALVEQDQQSNFALMPEREDLFSLLKRAKESGDPDARAQLARIGEATMFALSDVKTSGANQLGTAAIQGGWIGHIWEGNANDRVIVPLLQHGNLTKLTWTGWKWNAKPTMAAWAGNKADVPSAAVTATAVTGSATRFAGGHDLAREFYDFNETEAIEAYAQAMVESYLTLSDNYTIDQLIAGSTALTAGTYPAGVSDAIGKIVQGALAVIAAQATPTFAILSPALFAEYAYTMRDNTLEFLATSSGLTDGQLAGIRIVPDPTGSLAADEVLVGARRAATVLELPGSPVRVNALDLVHGGVDSAFFGYIGVQIDKATALQLVSDGA